MTTSSVLGGLVRPDAPDAPARGGGSAARRLPVTVLGLLGAAAVAYGVALPWLSTFRGLLAQSGWGTRNGSILVAGAVAAAILSMAQLRRPGLTVRWLLAATGFGLAGFGGYLLVELYAALGRLDGMTLAAQGPGLYVVVAGALAVFGTIFLPMPQPLAPPLRETGDQAVVASEAADRLTTRAIGSRWRYPAAALAVTAGLAHVPVTPAHLAEAPYIGVLFLVLTTACVLLATVLLIADSAVAWVALGGTCLLTVLGYVVSRTIGLPMMADDVGNWLELLGVVCVLAESGVVVLAVLALRGRTRRAGSSPGRT